MGLPTKAALHPESPFCFVWASWGIRTGLKVSQTRRRAGRSERRTVRAGAAPDATPDNEAAHSAPRGESPHGTTKSASPHGGVFLLVAQRRFESQSEWRAGSVGRIRPAG